MCMCMFHLEMNIFYSNHIFLPKGKELMIIFSGDKGVHRHYQHPYIPLGISTGEHSSALPQLPIASLLCLKVFSGQSDPLPPISIPEARSC